MTSSKLIRSLILVACNDRDTYDADTVINARKAIESMLNRFKVCDCTEDEIDAIVAAHKARNDSDG